jgi:hypothetical protein
MLQISGAMDSNHPVVQRARELVKKTGSAAMLSSFDRSIENQSLTRT